MGWDVYHLGTTKKEVLEDLDRHSKIATLLASKLIGKTYWQVFEFVRDGGKKERAIYCTLIEKPDPEDGYCTKVMDEAMGPDYYDCPLKFIELAGPTNHVGANNWRRNVVEYHAKQKEVSKTARELKQGSIVVYGEQQYELVTSEKRSSWIVRDVATGTKYRMPNSAIREAIAEAAEKQVEAEFESSFARPKETMPERNFAQGMLFV